jgi:hypothetical protein
MTTITGAVAGALYYVSDAAIKLAQDVDSATQIVRVCAQALRSLGFGISKEQSILVPLTNVINVTCEIAVIRNWIAGIGTLASGEAAGQKDENRIYIDEETSIPNFLRISSVTAMLISDLLGTIRWFDNIGLYNLSHIAARAGVGRFFSYFTFDHTRALFGITGAICDILDAFRDMNQNGRTWYNMTQVAGDVAKIVGVILFGSHGTLFIIALVANATASFCFLMQFLMKTYSFGGSA